MAHATALGGKVSWRAFLGWERCFSVCNDEM